MRTYPQVLSQHSQKTVVSLTWNYMLNVQSCILQLTFLCVVSNPPYNQNKSFLQCDRGGHYLCTKCCLCSFMCCQRFLESLRCWLSTVPEAPFALFHHIIKRELILNESSLFYLLGIPFSIVSTLHLSNLGCWKISLHCKVKFHTEIFGRGAHNWIHFTHSYATSESLFSSLNYVVSSRRKKKWSL